MHIFCFCNGTYIAQMSEKITYAFALLAILFGLYLPLLWIIYPRYLVSFSQWIVFIWIFNSGQFPVFFLAWMTLYLSLLSLNFLLLMKALTVQVIALYVTEHLATVRMSSTVSSGGTAAIPCRGALVYSMHVWPICPSKVVHIMLPKTPHCMIMFGM